MKATTIEWNPARDDDPGFTDVADRLAPAHGREGQLIPWCDHCELWGHPNVACPRS